jgi:hypothetical protein
MNSAALRFVPKEDLEKEGYGQYLRIFAKKKAITLTGLHDSCRGVSVAAELISLSSSKVSRTISSEFELQTEGHTFIPDEGLSRRRLARGAIRRLKI